MWILRASLAFAVSAQLAAVVGAAPIAKYNLATGGIEFIELMNVDIVRLRSLDVPLLVGSAMGPPHVSNLMDFEIVWGEDASPVLDPEFFGGTIVPPGVPASRLVFHYHFDGGRVEQLGQIVAVPEPSTFALAASSLLGRSLIRRRG